MSSKKHVQALMSEVGPAADLAEVLEFDDQNLWTLEYGAELLVEAVYDETLNRLVLSAEIGQPRGENRSGLYETLLQFNYLWEQTGGVRLALDGTGGNVVQLFELSAVELDLATLLSVLANFVENIDTWRQIIAQPPTETSAGEDLLADAMRV